MSLEEIQNQAIQTYNQNLEFFKINHPDIYKNIELFNAAIELKQVNPKFDLQYTNGYFDIKSIQNNQFLYNQNSSEISQQLVNDINLEAPINSFKAFYEHKYSDIIAKQALEKDILESSITGNAPIVHYVNKSLPKPEILKDIHKFIFFGVLLGLHIPLAHQRLNAKVYLIVEPNLEFFRLSMFVTNYAQLSSQAKLFFSVAQNEFDFKQTFDNFYGELFIFNHYFKFLNISDGSEPYMKIIQNHLVSQGHYLYSYDRTFLSLSRTASYISQDYKILNIEGKKNLKVFEKPILILGAGPSLQHNIDFVKQNQAYFTIVAIYATLPILERNSIKPDIITQYDEQDIQVLNTLNKLTDIKFFDDSLFLFASHVNSKLMNSFPKNSIFIYQAMFEIKENFGILTSPSIGELTYALTLKLGAKNIYLLGLDFALDNETGSTHIEGHSGSGAFSKLKEEEDSSDKNYSFRKNTIKIKGNFLEEVKSVPVFKSDIDTFNIFTATLKDNKTQVYNLSNGAFLDNTTPLKTENINFNTFSKKEDLKEELFSSLLTISEKGYSKSDLEKINLKISSVKKIKKFLEQFYKIKKYKNIEDYKNNLITTVQQILFEKHNCEDLQSILINYSSHTLHHIFHLLSLENKNDEKKYIYELNKAFYTQFDKIINTYVTCITYSPEENSLLMKKLNKYMKEYSIKNPIYSEPFLKELAETAPRGLQSSLLKNNIGFFISSDSLQNKNFVTYIKELIKRFSYIKIKAFYFFEYQKLMAQHTFKQELDKIEFIFPHTISDLANNIEVWIETSSKTNSLTKVNDILLNTYQNLYSCMFSNETYNNELEKFNEKNNHNEKNNEKKLYKAIKENYILPSNDYFTFANGLKTEIEEDKLNDLYKKEFISFFAFKENLQKEFIDHILTIYNTFPNIKFCVFYFDDNIKLEFAAIFRNILNRFEFKIPKDIYEIAQNSEVWVQAKIKNQSFLFIKMFAFLDSTPNIHTLKLDDEYIINTKASNYLEALVENYAETVFTKKLNTNLDEYRLQNTNPEDNIGFLATEDNLQDSEFIKLMNILFEKNYNIRYKVFYFNEEQKEFATTLFKDFIKQIDFIIPKDIYEIVTNISTYIYSYISYKKSKTSSYHKLWQILNKSKANLFLIHLHSEIKDIKTFSDKLILVDTSKILLEKSILSKIFDNDKRINEYSFFNSLNQPINQAKSRTMYSSNTITFFANKENLDSTFIEYIKKLIDRFPDTKFSAFYFNEQDLNFINDIFKNYLDRINLYIPQNIYDIAQNTEIYISNHNKNPKTMNSYLALIYNFEDIYSLPYNNDLKIININDYDNFSDLIIENYEEFGYTKEVIENNNYNTTKIFIRETLSMCNIENIDFNNFNLDEYSHFKIIEYIFKNNKIKSCFYIRHNKYLNFINEQKRLNKK